MFYISGKHKLYFLNLICLILALAAPFVLSWKYLLFSIFSGWIFATWGGAMGQHRYFTHKSFTVNRFWHYFILFCSVIVTVGSPISFAAIHRKHHEAPDVEGDPHSPHLHGWIYPMFGSFNCDHNYAKDLFKLPELVFVHKHYYKLVAGYAVLLTLINPLLLFPLWVFPCIMIKLMGGITNVICHLDKNITNNHLLALFTAGESIHKYHHDNPKAWKNPNPDMTGFFIGLIRKKVDTPNNLCYK